MTPNVHATITPVSHGGRPPFIWPPYAPIRRFEAGPWSSTTSGSGSSWWRTRSPTGRRSVLGPGPGGLRRPGGRGRHRGPPPVRGAPAGHRAPRHPPPRHAGHRGVPTDAGTLPGPHRDGQRRRRRAGRGAGLRAGGLRLRHQAVPAPGAGGPDERHPPAEGHGRRRAAGTRPPPPSRAGMDPTTHPGRPPPSDR